MHACSLVNSNLRGGITTVIEAILLVLQESVLLYKAVRFPVTTRIDWKQEQFPLWCCSEMVILGIEELGVVLIPTLVVIWTSFFNKDPLQINTIWFFLTTHVKFTLLGSALKQSALDVTIGESPQSIQISPVNNREEVTISNSLLYMPAVGFKIIAGTDTHFTDPSWHTFSCSCRV